MNKLIIAILFLLTQLISSSIYADGFTLSSPDINGQLSKSQVFNSFGCDGNNISPKLDWSNAPQGTKSFAVTVYDPDAPTGSGWWHWVIFDISKDIHTLESNAGQVKSSIAPEGSIQSNTSFGPTGFGGACPPVGDAPHQYIFTVFALKVEKLGLDSNATPAMVGFYLNSKQLAKASLIAYYGR